MKRWAVLLLLAAIPLCAQVSVESGKQARLQVHAVGDAGESALRHPQQWVQPQPAG